MNRPRTPASWSLLVFGAYALLMGLVLLILPAQVLPWFGITEVTGSWVHLLGFVLCCSSWYYLWAGRTGNRAFAWLTVQTRLVAPLVLLALLMAGRIDHMLLPFGIVDAAGGLWTAIALLLDKRSLG